MERQRSKRAAGLMSLGVVPLLGLGLAEASGRSSEEPQTPAQKAIPFGDARLKIEFNATDGDAGLQIFVDGEPWRRVPVTDPRGREVARFKSEDVIKDFGLTELFSESSEPPFEEFPFEQFKQLFPQGRYTFSGTTIEGQQLKSVVRFTHKVPDAPNIVTPGRRIRRGTRPADRLVGARHVTAGRQGGGLPGARRRRRARTRQSRCECST